MSIVDILVAIIVVTILVTIVLAVVTYIAYKLRLARRPAIADAPEVSRYFDVHRPDPAVRPEGPDAPTWVLEREPGGEGEPSEGAASSQEETREEDAPAPAARAG
jgi:hypothetical protein